MVMKIGVVESKIGYNWRYRCSSLGDQTLLPSVENLDIELKIGYNSTRIRDKYNIFAWKLGFSQGRPIY